MTLTMEKLNVALDYVNSIKDVGEQEVTLTVDFVLDLIETAKEYLDKTRN